MPIYQVLIAARSPKTSFEANAEQRFRQHCNLFSRNHKTARSPPACDSRKPRYSTCHHSSRLGRRWNGVTPLHTCNCSIRRCEIFTTQLRRAALLLSNNFQRVSSPRQLQHPPRQALLLQPLHSTPQTDPRESQYLPLRIAPSAPHTAGQPPARRTRHGAHWPPLALPSSFVNPPILSLHFPITFLCMPVSYRANGGVRSSGKMQHMAFKSFFFYSVKVVVGVDMNLLAPPLNHGFSAASLVTAWVYQVKSSREFRIVVRFGQRLPQRELVKHTLAAGSLFGIVNPPGSSIRWSGSSPPEFQPSIAL